MDTPGDTNADTNGDALAIRELNHVALYVRDLDASVRFYGGVLGLPPLPHPDFGSAVAWFAAGSQELHLIPVGPADPVETRSFHFALRVEDARAASLLLRARGVSDFQGPVPRPDGATQVFLRDPDGHAIELVSFPGR